MNDPNYYDKPTRDYSSLAKKPKAIAFYFTNEPKGGQPTHKRVLSTGRLEIIMSHFVAQLMVDVARNAKFGHLRGQALHSKNSYVQPLGDIEQKLNDF